MIDIWGAFGRSIRLGLVVMVLTVILSLMAGMAFRKSISNFLFYATISSLIVPSIVISLGVALEFRIIDFNWVIDANYNGRTSLLDIAIQAIDYDTYLGGRIGTIFESYDELALRRLNLPNCVASLPQ